MVHQAPPPTVKFSIYLLVAAKLRNADKYRALPNTATRQTGHGSMRRRSKWLRRAIWAAAFFDGSLELSVVVNGWLGAKHADNRRRVQLPRSAGPDMSYPTRPAHKIHLVWDFWQGWMTLALELPGCWKESARGRPKRGRSRPISSELPQTHHLRPLRTWRPSQKLSVILDVLLASALLT
jgi:hypothetical protein